MSTTQTLIFGMMATIQIGSNLPGRAQDHVGKILSAWNLTVTTSRTSIQGGGKEEKTESSKLFPRKRKKQEAARKIVGIGKERNEEMEKCA